MFDIRTYDKCDGTMGVDVVWSVLCVVFNDEDECRPGIGAVSDPINQLSDCVVVVRGLFLRSIDAIDGG